MIKHRFILRDEDFKIFAAIPVESSLLTWKKWQRPPDWTALKAVVERAIDTTARAVPAFANFSSAAQRLAEFTRTHMSAKLPVARVERDLIETMDSHGKWATLGGERAQVSADELRRVFHLLPPPEDAATNDLFLDAVNTFAESLRLNVDPDDSVNTLHENYTSQLDHIRRDGPLPAHLSEVGRQMTIAFSVFVRCIAEIRAVLAERRTHAEDVTKLLSSDPLPTTPCPPGLPFAAYTVEFNGTVVNVVEGHAWLVEVRSTQAQVNAAKDKIDRVVDLLPTNEVRTALKKVESLLATAPMKPQREPTPEERRVVEIVSQMLTERSLNPKADTKIPVREVDPKRAHQTREAEQRATTPAVRTIKFEVSPPRYLREAAEHILTSPRKAHWVIGHWRNQPYGEKRALHRQMWIKPHIRGLGEASATTARVVAPHGGPAT